MSRATKKKTPPPARPKKKSRSLGSKILVWLLTMAVWGGIIGAGIAAYYAHDLPDISNLEVAEKKHSIVIRSQDDVILANYGDLYGDFVTYNELPKNLVNALLATEDRRFWHHFGVDVIGLSRAVWHNYQAGHVVEGGSTITQQLAKNLFLSPERTLKRKIQEAMLAVALEYKFTKQQILTLYLNRVYLGSGTFGVDAAAKRYFQKPAKDLNLMESAMIVGLLKAPSRFSPTNNPELARARATQVMENMQDAGFITEADIKKAISQQAKTASYREGSMGSYYFADWLMEHLDEYIGHVDEDIEIKTTLDTRLQRQAEEVVEEAMKDSDKVHASQVALLSMSTDGAIRAMVGGLNYRTSQFNRVTQAKRQPGSSFKLFDYLTALEKGARPGDIWSDQPITIDNWSPENYGHQYKGDMPLTDAFAQSINTVAVQVAQWAGWDNVKEMAERLGVTSYILPTPSMALGANELTMLEIATAYDHLANHGHSVQGYGIEEITTSSGKSLYKRVHSARARVLSPQVVSDMYTLLRAVVTSGTGRAASLSCCEVFGKTGTSQDYRDAWFIGFTDRLLTAVWVGNDDNTAMKKITGGSIPARTWKAFMTKAYEKPLPKFMTAPLPIPQDDDVLPWQPPGSNDGESLPWQNNGDNAIMPPDASTPTPEVPEGAPTAVQTQPAAIAAPPAQTDGAAPVPLLEDEPPPAAPQPAGKTGENGSNSRFDDIIHTPIIKQP